jgi:hypothetical protein
VSTFLLNMRSNQILLRVAAILLLVLLQLKESFTGPSDKISDDFEVGLYV